MPVDLLTFAENVHDASLEAAKRLRFNKGFHADGALMCSYATLIEHTGGMIELTRARKRTSSTAVFRSMLEAYVDFRNLFQDRKYLNNMLAKFYADRLALLRRAADGGNPYLEDLGNWEGVGKALEMYEAELEGLDAAGFKPLKIWQRFERVGMENEYRAVYSHVSSGAHNDFGALRSRHAVLEQDDYGLHLYKQVELKDFQNELDGAVSYLITTSVMIHDYLKSDAKAQFEAMIVQLEEVRAAYPD
jgi:hypothetical protein